jgi:hypothetical protein
MGASHIRRQHAHQFLLKRQLSAGNIHTSHSISYYYNTDFSF